MSATFHSLRVAAIDELTDDAVALTFEVPPSLASEFTFLPGQHLSIRGGDDVRRSYSLCSSPSSGVLRIGVKRLPGGAFSDEGDRWIRFSYALPPQITQGAVARLHEGLSALANV